MNEEIEEEFQDAPRRGRPRPRPGRGRGVVTVELPVSLADEPSQARPFDQDRWLDDPPWQPDDPKLLAWEKAHGHDVRMKCFVEYGCQAVQYEADAHAERVAELEREMERIKRGYGKELADTEAELAQALGYEHDEQYGWIVGDHTPVTLAMQARRRIDQLHRQLGEIRLAAIAACDDTGVIDAGWLLGLAAPPPSFPYNELWQSRPRRRATCAPDCNWLQTREHAASCQVEGGDDGLAAGPDTPDGHSAR